MAIFEDVRLVWLDQEYMIKSTRVLRAIAQVEDVITLAKLREFYQRGEAPMARVALAYGGLLRYAGAKVTDDEVAISINASNIDEIMAAIMALLMMMVPKKAPAASGETGQADPPPGNADPTATSAS